MARLHEDAKRELIGDITHGRYREGDVIREQDVVDRFEFSRPVARECLRALETVGVISTRHGRGSLVAPQDEWNRLDREVLAALLSSDHAPSVLREFLECRRILEVEAAGLAAERATEVRVRSLEAAFGRMRVTAEEARRDPSAERRYQEADVSFHREVLLAAANPALADLTEPIHHALNSTVGALARPADRFERGLPEHERILSAISAQEPSAARDAMRAHLRTVEGYLRDLPA